MKNLLRNKKGGGLQAFLTASLAIVLMYWVIFIIFGTGGGFKTVFNLGKFVAQVPIWVWIGIAAFWLLSQARK